MLERNPITWLRALRDRVSNLETIVDNLGARAEEDRSARLADRPHILLENVQLTEKRIAEVQAAIIRFIETRTSEIYQDLVRLIDTGHDRSRSEFSKIVTELRRAVAVSTMDTHRLRHEQKGTQPRQVISDALYVLFEDAFRGEQSVIRERQRSYLDIVRDHAIGRGPVLDVGPGRGEWLELLVENGIQASGVELNPVFVQECSEKGLNVRSGRLPGCLEDLRDGDLGVLTMFQVAEHLTLEDLQDTIVSARRVLAPGGLLLVEIPNIETVSVGGASFWLDPTHIRPLHPHVVEFLAKQAGFARTFRIYPNHLLAQPDFRSLEAEIGVYMRELGRIVAGPPDVAICAVA